MPPKLSMSVRKSNYVEEFGEEIFKVKVFNFLNTRQY